ncbi:MAG: hypothetical protein ACK4PI_07480 [Tepidisphaerales bacterium]
MSVAPPPSPPSTPPGASSPPTPPAAPPSMPRSPQPVASASPGGFARTRTPIVIVMVVALLLSVLGRELAMAYRGRGSTFATASSTNLGSFDSYAIALLLGGLRGPLVMILWPSSEQQKADRDLTDFDTKVEWIRLLQPEFDSVHIFQIWNKAYNISVQMASLSNKYSTILDALDYADSVDRERPDNINILMAKAQVWFDKLGNSQEKVYYRQRVRQETQFRPESAVRLRRDTARLRLSLDPRLDAEGRLLPQYVTPRGRLAGLVSPDLDAPNGADLQYLQQFEPYPYGLSPLAVGYNYYKRSQMLQSLGKQRHLQLSRLVIDSRPAISLKSWAEEEWERGRRFEAQAFGRSASVTLDRGSLEAVTADLSPDAHPKDKAAADAALYSYRRVIQLGEAALKEYRRHIDGFPQSINTYRSHQDTINAFMLVARADHDYLLAQLTDDPAERKRLLAAAKENYLAASERFGLICVRYYVDEWVYAQLLPPGVSRWELAPDPARPNFLTQLAVRADRLTRERTDLPDLHLEDRAEYLQYLSRANMRIDLIGRN